MTDHTYTILLVLDSDASTPEAWINFARGIAPEGQPYEILIRGMVTVIEEESLSVGAKPAQIWRDHLTSAAHINAEVQDAVRAYVDYQPALRAFDEAREKQADLIIFEWRGPLSLTGGIYTDALLSGAPTDIILLTAPPLSSHLPALLSLRGGPNITLGIRAAKSLSSEGAITLYHAADSQRHTPYLEYIKRAEPNIKRAVTAITDIADGIVGELHGHSAVILGAALRGPTPDQTPRDSLIAQVYERATVPIALVRAYHPEALEFHMPYIAGSADEPSKKVDRWFAENTFHSREFSDLKALLEMKEKQGLSISIGLPALNEEETVENVIMTLKRALMDEVPLVDEFVLIDSNSTDNTVAIAESCGIPVYRHMDILTDMGSRVGKGEALWKSLHALKGDIIAWVDTDITNIHPRFIYGIIGPLLKYPHLQFVKGFYQRPIKVGEKLQAYGGGRVTELVARPMLNLFYPELSGFIQPLSGEYAGRRSALEKIPFFTGYGVETGMLIDLLDTAGLEGVSQSDLEVRVHHNQPLEGLSRMSFAILQVFMDRLGERFEIDLMSHANRSMKMILQEPERFALELNEIGDYERPPMITLPQYQARREALAAKA